MDKVELGQVFIAYLGFPCRSFYGLLHTHHHPSSSEAGTIGLVVADVTSGFSRTTLQETKILNELQVAVFLQAEEKHQGLCTIHT
jgi:hypothetical protein